MLIIATSITVAGASVTGADVKCLDKWPFCYRYTPPCDNETQNVHDVCSRRCELCEPNTSDNESCIDKVDCTPYNLSQGCKSNNWFREYCPSSCGFCSDVPGDHVVEIWRWIWISASIILALSVIFLVIVIIRRYKKRKDHTTCDSPKCRRKQLKLIHEFLEAHSSLSSTARPRSHVYISTPQLPKYTSVPNAVPVPWNDPNENLEVCQFCFYYHQVKGTCLARSSTCIENDDKCKEAWKDMIDFYEDVEAIGQCVCGSLRNEDPLSLYGNVPNEDARVHQIYGNTPYEGASVHQTCGNVPYEEAYIHQTCGIVPNEEAYIHHIDGNVPNEEAYIHKIYGNMPYEEASVHRIYGNAPNEEAYVHKIYGNAPNEEASEHRIYGNAPNEEASEHRIYGNVPYEEASEHRIYGNLSKEESIVHGISENLQDEGVSEHPIYENIPNDRDKLHHIYENL